MLCARLDLTRFDGHLTRPKLRALRQLVDPSVLSGLLLTVGDISITAAMLYGLVQWHRFVSKTLFENRDKLPTTRMLMPDGSGMSPQLRGRIGERVYSDFELSLPGVEEVTSNAGMARTRVREIVSLIISRVGNGKLVLQHNIEYGFVRNLIGGALSAFVVSMGAVITFAWLLPNPPALRIAEFMVIAYALAASIALITLKHFSQEYARVLFREYVER